MNVGTLTVPDSVIVQIGKSKLPARVMKLLETASFRELHDHFIRLTVTTALDMG